MTDITVGGRVPPRIRAPFYDDNRAMASFEDVLGSLLCPEDVLDSQVPSLAALDTSTAERDASAAAALACSSATLFSAAAEPGSGRPGFA